MTRRREELDDLVAPLATKGGQRWLRGAAGGLLFLEVVALLIVGADRPAKPHLLDPGAVAAAQGNPVPSRVAGFDQVAFRVVMAGKGGAGRPGCALLADTPARQAEGLMGRRDLAGYDAMIFRFPADTTVAFYNKGVPMPLAVAWFDGVGVYIHQTDMPVCDLACPLVGPGQPFRYALEVRTGGLGHLGVGPGAVLLVGGVCV